MSIYLCMRPFEATARQKIVGSQTIKRFNAKVGVNKGRHQKKNTGLFGNFSQIADPPPLLGISTIFYRFFLVKLEIFG